jgi:probable HAF family extracellular repeat protein
VGQYTDANFMVHGFLLSGGQYTTLNAPNAAFTSAAGINARGQIVGYESNNPDANATNSGFLLSGGKYTTLDDPKAGTGTGFFVGTRAFGINGRGQIVGFYTDARFQDHGFLLSGGQYTTINDPNAAGFTVAFGINARGQIVGSYIDASGQHGFLLSGGQYTNIAVPGALDTSALGINDRGQIVGYYFAAGGATHGFLLSGGQYTTIDDPNAVSISVASGINNRGQIVGYYNNANGSTSGFLATKAHGDDGHGDDAPAGASPAAGRASGDNAQLLLPSAVVTNATFKANQVIDVTGGSGADRSDGWSGISTGQTRAVVTLPSALLGSGDRVGGRVPVVSAAGTDTGLPGNDVFARSDDIFRVDL